MAFIPQEEEQFEIMMTPFIDCVFLLLVYFLVATSFYKEEKDITIRLPEASESSVTPSQDTSVVINIRKSGVYVVKGRVLSLAEVQTLLEEAQTAGPKPSVVLRGDQDALHVDVVEVMNACLKAGISNISVATFRSKGTTP